MISEQALIVLSEEIPSYLLRPDEFDRIYLTFADEFTSVVLQTFRGERSCGYRFGNSLVIDLETAIKCCREYYRRREIN